MSQPDLSFLMRAQEALGANDAPAPGETERRQVETRPKGRLASVIEELRASKAELEAQNKVLQYSQTAAERASERFETLFASVPLALMVLDEHDMVIQANPMAHRSFQPTEADRPLTSLQPFVSRDDLPRVQQAFLSAAWHGHSEVTEVVLEVGEHGRIMGDLHIARIDPTQDEEAPIQRQFLCAVIDQGPLLAERQALQESAQALQQRNQQIRASEARLEAVINSALDAIICVDKHQRITVFNPTASVLFQCPTADALGSPLERFLPSANEALAFTQISTQAQLGELSARTAAGQELAIEVAVTVERNGDDETTTVFARDLTGRKKAEAHRAMLEAQLRESQKMQAMGTLAGGIAHDFNNILGAILGNVALALGDLPADSPAVVSLGEIDKAGRRARELVRQILTFSRNEPAKRHPLALADVVRETEQLVRVTLPPTIELHLHLPADLPPVLADATQVEQAVLNLCTNAVHAMGDHRGHIDLQMALLEPAARQCERLNLKPGRYVRLSVQDSGQGMDAATLERIFEPFFTTKPVGQGTGLGLSVVHGVMRTHEGAVDVQSAPGVGSTFSLYFPVAEGLPADAAHATLAPATTAPAPYHPLKTSPGHRVFYVDDDEALVFLVERLLRRQGYRVTSFTDPRLAAQALQNDPTACDLLVTDYNMPGFSGVDLLREVRRIRPDLPVALASGYVTAEIERNALAEGARALIHKPNDVEELCATVRQLLA